MAGFSWLLLVGRPMPEVASDQPDGVLQPPQYGPRELAAALAEIESQFAARSDPGDQDVANPLVHVAGAAGQHHALMGIDADVRLEVAGELGDQALAFHRRAFTTVHGNVGHGCGDGMQSGVIRIHGTASEAAGVAMQGGTLAIYGGAGDRLGAGMCGGELFVRGDVGRFAGIGALDGTIVIGGNAGEGLGDAMSGATIFIRGSAASLAPDVVETPLRPREMIRLGLLLINASIRGEAKDFRRVVARDVLEAEQRQPRGEIDPSWR